MRGVFRRLCLIAHAAHMHAKPLPAPSSGLLFRHQQSLPKLPVPLLAETLQKYLVSVRPLLSDAEFANTQHAVADFARPGGMGETLQEKLLNRSRTESKGWLADWWTDYAYMAYRDPVVLNVNYFFHFRDDKRIKKQTKRAATLIQGAMQFRSLVINETLEPEKAKSGPLDSEQYRYMFNACRIPRPSADIVSTFDSVKHNHIVVVRKNKFYKLEMFHANGHALSTQEIEQQLNQIVQDAGNNADPAIGALTTENRDKWKDVRSAMISADPKNAIALEAIESSVFLVCLDDKTAITREEMSRLLWHGDGRNRYFDKALQFIITENGKAGFNGEHSMMDATPTGRLCEWILINLDKNLIDHGTSSVTNLQRPTKLQFNITPSLKTAITEAEKSFDEAINAHEVEVLAYDGYGKGLIKKFGMSPDGYVQMALQLAYYKMYGECRPTYESAQTRKFAFGRTETGRSVSSESVAWVKAMESLTVTNKEKLDLLEKAIKYHSKYMADASEGKGVDRHLLGLRLLLNPDEPKPSIFTDPAYSRTAHWNLSTSQLTSEYYDGYGWGEVVPDGFGLAYMVKENSIHVNMVSRKLKSDHLRYYMTEALKEMRIIGEAKLAASADNQPAQPSHHKAKL